MNLVRVRPIIDTSNVPDFGEAFRCHLYEKNNLSVRAESLSAWSLLAEMLDELPVVGFTSNGKPYFEDDSFRFSLSHSGRLSAVLLSDSPCGIDIERVRPEAAQKLRSRCLLPDEADMDFFEAWTLKESIGKMTGEGIRPRTVDTTKYPNLNRFSQVISHNGVLYRLSAVSESSDHFQVELSDDIEKARS